MAWEGAENTTFSISFLVIHLFVNHVRYFFNFSDTVTFSMESTPSCFDERTSMIVIRDTFPDTCMSITQQTTLTLTRNPQDVIDNPVIDIHVETRDMDCANTFHVAPYREVIQCDGNTQRQALCHLTNVERDDSGNYTSCDFACDCEVVTCLDESHVYLRILDVDMGYLCELQIH